ncbi:MAG: hypothetical protein OXU81_04575 [Gammaproteobacteria bacterium]|nr:hypothetical protein [Gammaproteobacteria bacterium]
MRISLLHSEGFRASSIVAQLVRLHRRFSTVSDAREIRTQLWIQVPASGSFVSGGCHHDLPNQQVPTVVARAISRRPPRESQLRGDTGGYFNDSSVSSKQGGFGSLFLFSFR